MERAECLLTNRQGALVIGLGSGVVALGFQQCAQVIEALGSIGVERAERLLTNGQGALEVGPGSGVVGDTIQQCAQVIKASSSIGVERAECLLTNGQGALEVGPGSGVVALGLQQEAQVIEASRPSSLLWIMVLGTYQEQSQKSINHSSRDGLLVAVSGWSGPSACSKMARARS